MGKCPIGHTAGHTEDQRVSRIGGIRSRHRTKGRHATLEADGDESSEIRLGLLKDSPSFGGASPWRGRRMGLFRLSLGNRTLASLHNHRPVHIGGPVPAAPNPVYQHHCGWADDCKGSTVDGSTDRNDRHDCQRPDRPAKEVFHGNLHV